MLSTIGKYIDALYVSVIFEMPDALRDLLAAAKEDAKASGDDLLRLVELAGVPGGPFYMRPAGRGKYQYVLENGCYWLAFSTWANMPALQLQFKANTLYEYEPEVYGDLVDRVVRGFLGTGATVGDQDSLHVPYEVKVSRCDLAVDFQMEQFRLPAMEDVITRARQRAQYYRGARATSITLGQRNQALQSQIYCKSEEVLTGDKSWMFDVWRATGNYREDLPVWRAELRFFREGLRAFDVFTVAELVEVLGDLCRYAVGDGPGSWMRVADPESRDLKIVTQRSTVGWWSSLAEFFCAGLLSVGRKRRRYDPKPSLDRCIRLAGSMMARAAALHRIGYEARTPLRPDEFGRWVGREYEKRLSRSGSGWADKVNVGTAALRAVVY